MTARLCLSALLCWSWLLLTACAAPGATSARTEATTAADSTPLAADATAPISDRAPLAPVDGDALLAELLKDLRRADAVMPEDDEHGLLAPVGDSLALLLAYGPAMGSEPTAASRWPEVEALARSALVRLEDPRAELGAQTQAFVLNETNLQTLRASHPLRLAVNDELRVWRGLLLDLSGREDEARGWFAGILADGRAGEFRLPIERQWRAWRAWRDRRPDEAARQQAEVVRVTVRAGEGGLGPRELLVADLGLLLEAAGRQQESEEVLRTLLVRTMGRSGRVVTIPSSERPSWGSLLADSALRTRGVSLEVAPTRLVALGAQDVALLALQRGDEHAPDSLRRLVFAGRLGARDEPWQLWFADEAPIELLQDKAEQALLGASLRSIVGVLQLLQTFSGTLAPYVDDVVSNLARYPKRDIDDVSGIDTFLRDRLGLEPRKVEGHPVLYPEQFIDLWHSWVPGSK
jgi:hypothetical protein